MAARNKYLKYLPTVRDDISEMARDFTSEFLPMVTTFGDGQAILGKELFALIFVKVHRVITIPIAY